MSTTDTPLPRGSKIEFRAVHVLMQQAQDANRIEPGSGRPFMEQAKVEFDRWDFKGLLAAQHVARTFALLKIGE